MKLNDLARVELLEKQFKQIKYIRDLLKQGKTPYVGARNDGREEVNHPIPNFIAVEILDRQETAIRMEFDNLGVKVEDD